MNKELMFSSKTDEWYTPIDFFEELDWEFNFDLDPCSTDENAKCKMHYTKKENGLTKDWSGHNVFCNPPYGRELKYWVKKARVTHLKNIRMKKDNVVVMLIPARTDTKWFHDYIYNKNNVEVRFIKGRLKFGGCKNPAPFPSMVVIFRGYKHE